MNTWPTCGQPTDDEIDYTPVTFVWIGGEMMKLRDPEKVGGFWVGGKYAPVIPVVCVEARE
jgi:hypothetical protein